MTRTLFISHVTAERAVAEKLKTQMEAAFHPGLKAFVSTVDVMLGSPWLSEIEGALRKADAILVLCSRWSVERPWINFEAGVGRGRRKPVIPLCHGNMRTEDLPELLKALQGQNIHNASDCAALVDRLAKELGTDRVPDFDFRAMAEALSPAAKERRQVIAVDLNHGQRKWPKPADAERDKERRSLFWLAENPDANDFGIDFVPITNSVQFLSDDLWTAAGLIVASPWRAHIASETANIVRQWVYDGGRLLLLGFELGDLHHEANLNDLARSFGIQFGTDIIGPTHWAGSQKPWGEKVAYRIADSDPHELTRGIQQVNFVNMQSPGGTEWLRAARTFFTGRSASRSTTET